MINQLESTLYTSHAICTRPDTHTPTLKHGMIDSTQFMNVLHFKITARVMLTFNVNTIDKLVNGSIGTVLDVTLEKTNCLFNL